MKIRVLLVEDHRMVREALREVLTKVTDIEVVGEAGDARDGLEGARLLAPDVIVLDIRLPDLNGMEVAKRLREAGSTAKILALSAFSDKHFVREMLRSGASGYVTKSAAGTELVSAIRAVAGGQGYFSPEIAATLVADAHQNAVDPLAQPLGRREIQVLRLIAEGSRSAAIADQLQITSATVEVHRRNIMRKLGLRTVAELTKYAIREGIVAL
ncbi:MAG TPA: response regulator transcription factor [Steroidobacteraceae bacterium]|nr:response regulator transcription factor [Steroidobacteraceae bacterium]